MATFGRSLCLFVTLWMTGSRTPTVIPPRLPDSSLWWKQASPQIHKDARRLVDGGDYPAAAALYQHGYREALKAGNRVFAVKYLMSVGGCQLLGLQYRAALASFLEARKSAAALEHHLDLGAIAVNLSSLYLQMWDLPAASRAADEGLREEALNDIRSPGSSYYKAELLVQLGRIHSLLRDSRAETFFTQGIEAARARNNIALEANAWDLLGEERLASEHLAEAETSFLEAFRLRKYFRPIELGFSYGHLGASALARHDLEAAGRLTRLALQAVRRKQPAWPEYLLIHQQGSILLAQGKANAALDEFSLAIEASAKWRVQVLPAQSSLTSSNVALEQRIFHSFIQLAAEHAFQNGNVVWAARAFQAVEMNRAASLRESLGLADIWRENLPSEYWETLAQLGAQEAQSAGSDELNPSADRLHLRLTEMEAQVGIGLQTKKIENFSSQNSLIHFQAGLRDSELLLSFELGKKESYLWAVSRKSLRLYRLAPEQEIARAVQTFRDALPTGGLETAEQGQQLYQLLFGQLSPGEVHKPSWLLSLDGALFDVPFAALVTEQQGGNTVYLVEKHSLQTVPGALLLSASQDPGIHGGVNRGEFLGVGDPVYNQVDPRWQGRISHRPAASQLERLVGSREEVESSAASFVEGGGTATILEGAEASRSGFLRGLEARPAVIHLATHVLFPTSSREQALIAFGLRRSPAAVAGPEFITTSEIAGLRVPGALVVMTGCATGIGEAHVGAGLLGLTRAWLMAGASTVISTAWPVEDSSGGMFARFYYHLRSHSAAEALQLSQREVAHSRTGRLAPASWASYQLTGGTH
jgi:CHAT domain-containing protein